MNSEMGQLARRYETAMGFPPSPEAITEMEFHVQRRGAHFVAYCIAEARRRKARSWGYIKSILRNQDTELIDPEKPMPHNIGDLLDDEDYRKRTTDAFLENLDTYAACIGERLSDDDLEFLMETFNERGEHYVSYLIFEAASRGQRRMEYIRALHGEMPMPVFDKHMLKDAFEGPSVFRKAPGKTLPDILPFSVVEPAEDESIARESES